MVCVNLVKRQYIPGYNSQLLEDTELGFHSSYKDLKNPLYKFLTYLTRFMLVNISTKAIVSDSILKM